MKRVNLLALLLCAALAALFLLVPSFLGDRLHTDIVRQWLQPKREEWSGVLRVWHVGQWQAGKGSAANFLGERGKEFEKKHPGVYIEVQSMTPDGALERFARGENPDLVSFPGGWGQPGSFTVIEAAEAGVFGYLLESGRVNGKQLALPYMLSCYLFLYNEDLFSDADLEIPLDVATNFAENCARLTYSKKLGKKTLSYVGLEVPEGTGGLPAAALLGRDLVPGANNYVFGSAAFKAGAAAMAVGTMRDLAEPERYSFSVKAEPLTSFTDMVQYIGIWKSIQSEALPYAQAFANSLLVEGAQKKLESLYAFPVRSVASLYDSDPLLKELGELAARASVPRAFRYAKGVQELLPLAKAALDGDVRSLAGLREELGKISVRAESLTTDAAK